MSDSMELLEAIGKICKLVTRNDDGTFNLAHLNADEIGISQALLTDLCQSLERTNDFIRSGDIDSSDIK
jgi:hypothetical protein